MTLEREVEAELVKQCDKRDWLCIKMKAISVAGWPDRFILAPGPRFCFVECKRPGGQLRPLQKYWRKRLEGFGCTYYVLDRVEDAAGLLERWSSGLEA